MGVMSGIDVEAAERTLVAGYLQEHALENNLNELINKCVRDRPDDPYMFLCDLLKEKSGATRGIISLRAREMFAINGELTIEAEITTSMGRFKYFLCHLLVFLLVLPLNCVFFFFFWKLSPQGLCGLWS